MCGIFGVVRNQSAAHPERVTAVIQELGNHSETRGRDSSGIAYIPVDAQVNSSSVTKARVEEKISNLIGGTTIIKDTVPFTRFWNDERDVPLATTAVVMIGHTRAATQGSKGSLANTSPLAIGTLIGTHNGDIEPESVSEYLSSNYTFGGTDTEKLYRAIDSVKSHRAKITKILEKAEGRVALAWYDRKITGRINLARGGLSPMVIAFDAEGNMYWASSPQWFRDIDEKFDGKIGFTDIFIVPEGTLITVRFNTGKPVIENIRNFQPTVRTSDTMLGEGIVLRGFEEEDRKANKLVTIHNVVPNRPKAVTKVGSYNYSGTGSTSTYNKTSTVYGNDEWDAETHQPNWLKEYNQTLNRIWDETDSQSVAATDFIEPMNAEDEDVALYYDEYIQEPEDVFSANIDESSEAHELITYINSLLKEDQFEELEDVYNAFITSSNPGAINNFREEMIEAYTSNDTTIIKKISKNYSLSGWQSAGFAVRGLRDVLLELE